MTNRRVSRRRAAALLPLGAAASVVPGRVRAQPLDKLTYQTGWRAQAQHGGIYQAIATGLYRQYGLEVEVRHGGPQLDINTLLLAGRVDFIESNLFSALTYARESLPGIAVAAVFQKDERVLLAHPGVGNDTLPALKGKPKAMCTQGFLTTEPLALRAAGVDPVIHLLADHGFANYQGLMMCSPALVNEKTELVQRFVDATLKGWASYLGGDPSPGNFLIKRDNPDMTDDKIAYAIATMRQHRLADDGDAATLGLGAMTADRWSSFYREMVAVGALPAGLAIDRLFTLRFVNKRVAML
jgi:NitT/TauT family transport system substrate-binding protein